MTHSTRIKHTRLAIVGSGPAGMMAAIAAAELGVEVTVLDSQQTPGGQYFKQMPPAFSQKGIIDNDNQNTPDPISRFNASQTQFLPNTEVINISRSKEQDGWRLLATTPEGSQLVCADYVILATGAYDRPVAFPGWTLPGVITAGGLQSYVKNQLVLPGTRFLFSGSGPLQFSVAANLVQQGASVAGVFEMVQFSISALRYLPALWGQNNRIAEGIGYLRTLSRHGVPIQPGWSIVRALGDEKVEGAVVCRLDRFSRPRVGSERTIAVDTIVLGYGLIPHAGLARQAGCRFRHSNQWGHPVPTRDQYNQTSEAGLFVVGDGVQIGGAQLAMLEGELAGLAVAHHANLIKPDEFQRRARNLHSQIHRELKFAACLEDLFHLENGLIHLMDPETVVCRCEEVTYAEIKQAVALGARTAREIKGISRIGMGNCQGRVCQPILSELLKHIIPASEWHDKTDGIFSCRPPHWPVRLDTLGETFPTRSNGDPETCITDKAK
jgi:D-hydroxyproline dehydrogenase subunit alpha